MKIIDMHNRKSTYTVRCDRATILGNPCSIPNVPCPMCQKIHFGPRMAELTPCRSIPGFREWLWDRIHEGDKKILSAIFAIKEGDTLACWCCEMDAEAIFEDEEVCHTQVIWKAWAYLTGWG